MAKFDPPPAQNSHPRRSTFFSQVITLWTALPNLAQIRLRGGLLGKICRQTTRVVYNEHYLYFLFTKFQHIPPVL